ncbi:secretion-regulating guanine nucleotide exchange factor isoform X1 [Lingula anatina]|uniref:Secretion-regulating guanine nucleotide exchange factor isoform X1 n=2 Tax=Lingula anatina TaxID=7574 RepID=A0A1S3JZ09_LINAN|nr:secretion-regulating guanine nucleotide exchange factor isoform X1 [Lingula anatina]|eukprot:XP_013415628.1 secretion-regulating guanine nucleotide exchange factor isoform X1 [Lingula anatina]
MEAPCRKFFAWGANSHGQLALGHTEDQMLPKTTEDFNIPLRHATGGGGHTLLLTDSGQLFACGNNNKGQLGLQHTEEMFRPQIVKALEKELTVCAKGGWDFTLVLSNEKKLYACGSNMFGQLGLTPVQSYVSSPTPVNLNCLVKDLSTGLRHSVLLTEKGNVLTMGSGKKGQQGVLVNDVPPKIVTTPNEVAFPSGPMTATQVVAGSHHTACLSDQGQVFVWGCNKYGQCALDPHTQPQVNRPHCVPQKVFRNKKVCQVYSGWTHLLAVTDDGQVFSWGRADYGQLGRPVQSGQLCDFTPTPIESIPQVSQLCCGSEHSLAITADSKVLTWGWNEHGICGTGDEINVMTPQTVKTLDTFRTVLIGAGAGHSMALCEVPSSS